MGRNGGVSAFFFLRLVKVFQQGADACCQRAGSSPPPFAGSSRSHPRAAGCKPQLNVFFFSSSLFFFPSNHTVSDSQLPCACQRLQVLHRPANELPMRRGFSPFGSSPFPFRFPGSFGHGFPSISIGALLPLSPLCWDIGGRFSGTLQGQEQLRNIAGSFLLRSLDPFCI